MASVWRHPQSQFWSACWTDGKGRRVKRSTKTTDKRLAERLAQQFEAESRAKRTARQARKILGDIYKSVAGEELPSMTVREYLVGFMERKRPEVASSTSEYYASNSTRFLAWLGKRGDEDIADITQSDLVAYRNFLATSRGPTAVNNSLKCIKTYFACARKEGFILENPAEHVDGVRDRGESTRRGFTLEELQKVLALATTEWASLIRFGFFTGQRLGDVATIKWSNIDLDKNELRLVTKKTARKMAIPIPAPLRRHIDSLPGPRDPAAPLHPYGHETVTRTGKTSLLGKDFAKLLVKAGLRTKTRLPAEGHVRSRHDVSFHSLRHSATSILKDAGVPQIAVLSFIGHDTDAVSAGYSHVGASAMQQAADAFPEL